MKINSTLTAVLVAVAIISGFAAEAQQTITGIPAPAYTSYGKTRKLITATLAPGKAVAISWCNQSPSLDSTAGITLVTMSNNVEISESPVTIGTLNLPSGSMQWAPPINPDGQHMFKLRVTWYDAFGGPGPVANSYVFRIQQSAITMTSPFNESPPVIWSIGTKHDVTWSSVNVSAGSQVSMYLAPDDGAYVPILVGQSSDTGGTKWEIPQTINPGPYFLYLIADDGNEGLLSNVAKLDIQ